mmetsp:Transcript_77957/g.196880  ORF Transcript_77957/g.196880 Transcript_77957/m.196880 type:complete len:288 (+) Transcript_77957:458-1321(+)
MNVPVSISRILETSMPSGLLACSSNSQSFNISPAKVSCRLSIKPEKRLRCRGSMWKWSNNSTMSGSGAVLSSCFFVSAGAVGLGNAMFPAMPPTLLTEPIMAMASMGFWWAVIASSGLAAGFIMPPAAPMPIMPPPAAACACIFLRKAAGTLARSTLGFPVPIMPWQPPIPIIPGMPLGWPGMPPAMPPAMPPIMPPGMPPAMPGMPPMPPAMLPGIPPMPPPMPAMPPIIPDIMFGMLDMLGMALPPAMGIDCMPPQPPPQPPPPPPRPEFCTHGLRAVAMPWRLL